MTTTLPLPKTLMSELLFRMIHGEKVSEREIQANSFRSRISDLNTKHGVIINYDSVKFINRHGHAGVYRVHYILEQHREKAEQVYLEMAKSEKERSERLKRGINSLANKMKV